MEKTTKQDGRKNNRFIKPGRFKLPENELKVNISIFAKRGDIERLGGRDKVRELLRKAIVKELSIQ